MEAESPTVEEPEKVQVETPEEEAAEGKPLEEKPDKKEETKEMLSIGSPAFVHNEMIPSKYTCDSDNINPPLLISGIPEGTESLALIVDDPDAPGGTWVHWIVWNIGPATTEIKENSAPEGAVEGMTDFGKPGYGGPCPPSGTHRYFFKLYALDTTLKLDASATVEELENAMEDHLLDKAELIGLYERK
ncbi:MAG: YbhB/YbcL family Raf kinase inhibitor-like protein [Candidatus Humimicrobiaceae bacterium]